jgi:hypothetical protein
LRHQYVAKLLRREKIFTETFVPDGSHPSGQRTLGQIEHPREIKSNSEYDARVLVDIDALLGDVTGAQFLHFVDDMFQLLAWYSSNELSPRLQTRETVILLSEKRSLLISEHSL